MEDIYRFCIPRNLEARFREIVQQMRSQEGGDAILEVRVPEYGGAVVVHIPPSLLAQFGAILGDVGQ